MARHRTAESMQQRLSQSFRRIPPEDTPRIFRIPLDEIALDSDQPRRHLDPDALKELAASIARHGLIQPITLVRTDKGRYRLVAGERRYRAHRLLGRTDILGGVTTGDAEEISLIENIQREDLHPLEEAAAYMRMMAAHAWTQEQLAAAVGKARPTITNLLKLNQLPEAIRRESTSRPEIGRSLLLEIARVDDPVEQWALWEAIKQGGTVRAARAHQMQSEDSTRGATQGVEQGRGKPPMDAALSRAIALSRDVLRRLRRLERVGATEGDQAELCRLYAELGAAIARLTPVRDV